MYYNKVNTLYKTVINSSQNFDTIQPCSFLTILKKLYDFFISLYRIPNTVIHIYTKYVIRNKTYVSKLSNVYPENNMGNNTSF